MRTNCCDLSVRLIFLDNKYVKSAVNTQFYRVHKNFVDKKTNISYNIRIGKSLTITFERSKNEPGKKAPEPH